MLYLELRNPARLVLRLNGMFSSIGRGGPTSKTLWTARINRRLWRQTFLFHRIASWTWLPVPQMQDLGGTVDFSV